MSTVEDAASLFGSDGDAEPDPFAVIGNEDSDTTQAFGPSFVQQVVEHALHDSSSYPVDMGQDASTLFAEQIYPDAQTVQQDPWSIPTSQDSSIAQPDVAPAPYVQQQSWYSEVHSTSYEPRPVHASSSVSRNTFTNDYDPYKPSSVPQHESFDPTALSYTPAQTNDGPYKATTASSVSPYTLQQPSAPSLPKSADDTHRPISRSVSSPYASASVASAAPPPLPQNLSAAQTTSQAATVASYRPKTSNAYDPPLPPPKTKRAVSMRAPRSESPVIAHQTYPVHGQQAMSPPPVPPVPLVPGNAKYGSAPIPSVPPPRPPSGPPQRSMPYESAQGVQTVHSYTALNPQKPHVPPPESRLPPAPHHAPSSQRPVLSDPYGSNAYHQGTYGGVSAEGSSTHRHPSGDSLSLGTPASQVHDVASEQQQHRDANALYTSDDMPWDSLEGGFESGFSNGGPDPFSGSPAVSVQHSNIAMNGYLPRQSAQVSLSVLREISPEPVTAAALMGVSDVTPGTSSAPTSPPRAKVHNRQNTVVPSERASPKPSSMHARGGSSGSSVSSVRGPVNRVSSPLRNAVEAHRHDAAYTPVTAARVTHPYDPSPYGPHHRTTSPASAHSLNNQQGIPPNFYGLPSHNVVTNQHDLDSAVYLERTASPGSHRSQSPAIDPYAPAKTVVGHVSSQLRERSSSNGSVLSSSSATHDALQQHEYGLGHRAGLAGPGSHGSIPAYPLSQDVHISGPRPPYAPSPSLLGSNDPLGRVSARAPIVSFGFGGRLLTCFHGSADLSTGFDVALSTRRTTNVTIQELHKVLPEYALESKSALYPGPLFSDPGSPVTSLVRTGASSNLKAKKLHIVKYLDERAEEISRGITYISDDFERRRAEDKLTLIRLLKIMVDNDGVLYGSPQIDTAVRVALVPHIANDSGDSGKDMSASLSTPALASSRAGAYGMLSTVVGGNETPVSVTTTLPSSLDKIQEFLVRGERRQAYHYALDEKLWPHAMIIASSIDKEAWKEVVSEFLKVELGVHDAVQYATASRSKNPSQCQTNGREWLRVVYSLFSGQGPTAIQELVPMNLLSRATGLQVPPPALPHTTPVLANFPSAVATQVPSESLSKWTDIVASVLTNASNSEWSTALTALGDCLLSHQQVEAAHVCYILSPQTSIAGGIGGPSTRIVLLGSQNPHTKFVFARDSDSIVLSEIFEFAISLKATPKGQEHFLGFPHLQTYKLIRAAYLADIGHVQAASRYCEAISALMGRPSPFFNAVMVDQLKALADRLIGAPQVDNSGSWISGKVNKPSLDSIGSWLEGRLTKFIAGEGDELSPTTNHKQPAFSGPFSAYGSLSSAGTSASPSPPPTMVGSQVTPTAQPPRRTGSAISLPSMQTHQPIDRASSAMEYYRPTREASPAPPKTAPIQPSYPFLPHVSQANGHATAHGYVSAYSSNASSRKSSLEITPEEGASALSPAQEQQPQESGGWWNALGSADSAPTPTAATFHKVEEVCLSEDGMISLMDDQALAVAPTSATPHRLETTFEDEEDDLGLGNNRSKKKPEASEEPSGAPPHSQAHQQETTKTEEKSEPQTGTQAPVAGGSWFTRFWKRSETPGPVRANLGEETSFYYDKELKRWVNKKVGSEAAQPSGPIPPPARAQTASPSQARRPGGPGGTSGPPFAPQLARTASAIDLSTPASSKPPMRTRSNLVPPEAVSVPTTPMPGASMSSGFAPPPPMGRPRSQAAKKNVRSRYVDVFQQEANAGAA